MMKYRTDFSVKVEKNNVLVKFLILIIFFCVLYWIRASYGLISDDEVVAKTIESQTLFENFIARWQYNGRIFTDVLANLFYRVPIFTWKTFDVLVYVGIALLMSKIFTQNSQRDLLVVCAMILLFPMQYLDSAGHIASSTNYVYPVACLLVITYFVWLISSGKQVRWWQYIITLLCVLYSTNHDQSAMVLIGGLFLYLIYCVISKENKFTIINIAFLLICSVTCCAFMFMIPGHIYRMTSTAEMEYWLPQYADWSFLKKIYHGFSTTVANFLFSDVKLFLLFALLLGVLSLSQDVVYKKIIAFIPLAIMVLVNYIGNEKFVVYYDYSCGMPDLIPLCKSVLPFLVTVISIASIFYTICSCIENRNRKYLILMLLILASGSREMMGLSATLYASSFRTFTFFLYAIIACCLLILQELKDKGTRYLWYLGLGMLAALVVY